jgi:hypothetical protein
MLQRIVSGGQTGVDRAALDAALEAGLACGGWCPRGRRAEDGAIPARYGLTETASRAYAVRTRRNVRDSDATLVLVRGPLAGGTKLTVEYAARTGRSCRVVDLDAADPGAEAEATARWVAAQEIAVLNVAGPRESGSPGIGAAARGFMDAVIAAARVIR